MDSADGLWVPGSRHVFLATSQTTRSPLLNQNRVTASFLSFVETLRESIEVCGCGRASSASGFVSLLISNLAHASLCCLRSGNGDVTGRPREPGLYDRGAVI